MDGRSVALVQQEPGVAQAAWGYRQRNQSDQRA
jgi:hypothetical protein